MSLERLERIREAFEDSGLPMRIDIVDWHALPAGLRQVINGNHEVLHCPETPDIAFS